MVRVILNLTPLLYWASSMSQMNDVLDASKWQFRPATALDVTDLVVLIDIASRGLLASVWRGMAGPGQSALEIGRGRIRDRQDLPSHYSKWHVATRSGEILGAYAGYVVPDPYDPGDVSGLPRLYKPMLELEALAAGTWHLMALAVYPEFRGLGLGTAMLGRAVETATACGCLVISIMANSANEGASRLYSRYGFEVRARRKYVPFRGSADRGDWLLFGKRTCIGCPTSD
jgi:ribosomal protein S18 acetylase RimI-like enzyme